MPARASHERRTWRRRGPSALVIASALLVTPGRARAGGAACPEADDRETSDYERAVLSLRDRVRGTAPGLDPEAPAQREREQVWFTQARGQLAGFRWLLERKRARLARLDAIVQRIDARSDLRGVIATAQQAASAEVATVEAFVRALERGPDGRGAALALWPAPRGRQPLFAFVLPASSSHGDVATPFLPVLSFTGRGVATHEQDHSAYFCGPRGFPTVAPPSLAYDPRAGDLFLDGHGASSAYRLLLGLFDLDELVSVSRVLHHLDERTKEVTALDVTSRSSLRYDEASRTLVVAQLDRVKVLSIRGSRAKKPRKHDRVSQEEWLAMRQRLLALAAAAP